MMFINNSIFSKAGTIFKPLKNIFKNKKTKYILSALLIYISLSWGVTNATNNDISTATSNFSLMGTIVSIDENQISLIEAKSSDLNNAGAYYLNINFVEIIQTKQYSKLNIKDIGIGDVVVTQGLTNGSTYFIKRIVRMSEGDNLFKEILNKNEDVANDLQGTSTKDVGADNAIGVELNEASNGGGVSGDLVESTSTIASTATSSDNVATSTDGVLINASSTDAASTTELFIDSDEESTSTTDVIDSMGTSTISDKDASATSTTNSDSGIMENLIDGATDIVNVVQDVIQDVARDVVDKVADVVMPDVDVNNNTSDGGVTDVSK